ncbi:MAG: tetratricopeptide repeat protein [Desulfobacterales bacterium]|nr:tetratricopeptide repeat protein [Desulfobacterales bacterium]
MKKNTSNNFDFLNLPVKQEFSGGQIQAKGLVDGIRKNAIEILNSLCYVELLERKWESALKSVEKILDLDAENETAKENKVYLDKQIAFHKSMLEEEILFKARVLTKNGSYIQALEILEQMLSENPEHKEAKALYDKVVEFANVDETVRHNVEELQVKDFKQTQSMTTMEESVKSAKKTIPPEELYQEIHLIIDNGQDKEAISKLENLLKQHPNFALAHNDLGVLYFDIDKSKSLAHYEKAVIIEPNNITFQKNLADFYFIEQKRFQDALEIYNNILKINPKDIETLASIGKVCEIFGNYDDAKVFYNNILAIEPWNFKAREMLDNLDSKKTQNFDLRSPEEIYNNAKTMIESGNEQDAIKELITLTTNHPYFAVAHNDLGVLYYNAGNKNKAIEHYETAVRLETGNTTFKKNLADFYLIESHKIEESLKIYVEILDQNPKDLEVLFSIAFISELFDRLDDAKVFYNIILDIEPWNTNARLKIDELENKTFAF